MGLLIIALGVAFTLHNLGLADLDRVFAYWPVLLIVVGIAKFLGYDWLGGMTWSLAGGVLLLPALIDRIEYEDLWPLLLILIGLRLAGRALPARLVGPPARTETATAFALMSATKRASLTDDFQGADLTAIMGGCELDLRQAELKSQATIDAFAFWGGIVIRVPRSWSVDLRVVPLMGGAEDHTHAPELGGGPRLRVRGVALMGGVEVRN